MDRLKSHYAGTKADMMTDQRTPKRPGVGPWTFTKAILPRRGFILIEMIPLVFNMSLDTSAVIKKQTSKKELYMLIHGLNKRATQNANSFCSKDFSVDNK